MYYAEAVPYWAGMAEAARYVPGMREWMAAARYWVIMNSLPRHTWITPHTIVARRGNAELLFFGGKKTGRVILINPPQASHGSSGCDFGPGSSLVQTAIVSGIGEVYVINWRGADWSRRNEDIDDFVGTMHEFFNWIGRKVDLIGVCQGGWQSAIYVALYPEKVRTLTLVASPINFHGEGSKITGWINTLPDWWFRSMVASGGGVLDGRWILFAFKLMHPVERFLGDHLRLYQNILNEEWAAVRKQIRFMSWYERDIQDLPGAFYLQVVRDLFKRNALVEGGMKVLGRRVGLGRIHCPVLLVIGKADDITTKPQACAMADCVGTSCSCQQFELEGGHFFTFAAKGAMEEWDKEIFPTIKAAA